MKFIVNSQLFAKQLTSLSGVLTNNNTIPIINCFYFELNGNELTMRATDLETTLVSRIEVDGAAEEEPSTIAVPSKLLLDILKLMDDAPLTFITDPKTFSIEISTTTGKYSLAGYNPETFPPMPGKENTQQVTIPASVLANAIAKTIFATSNEEMRQQMNGIFCELTPDGTTFVATDAHKLVRYRRTDVLAEESTNFILPRKPMALVKNILGGCGDSEVMMEYNNTNVFLSFNNTYIICRLVEGKYPNYEAAIPKENPNKLTLDRVAFLNSLRRVGLFASQSTHQIRLSISNENLTISAEDLEFSNDAHEKLSCSYEGSPMEIGFNAKFLTEMISNLDTEHVLMEMSLPSRAGIIFPIKDEEEASAENILMLVMPVMLAN